MNAIDQARIIFAPRAHRGGKQYIHALIKSIESALKGTETPPKFANAMEADYYITEQIGLVDQGLNEMWMRRVRLAGSLKIEPKAKEFWQRLGRYIQANTFWPGEAVMKNWPEWQILSEGKIPLPTQSSATARKRKQALKVKRAQELKQAEQDRLQARARLQEQERAEHKDEVDVMDLVSTLTEDMREIRSRCKKLEGGLRVLAQPVDNAVTLASKASKEVRGMRDHLLSLENRILEVEKLGPHMDDLWHMIDIATAPKNDKPPQEEKPEKPKSWLRQLKS
jgi:hypothetical protein